MKKTRSSVMACTLLSSFLLVILLSWSGVAQTRDPLPVPGIPGYKTLKGDFHLHTVVSDGEVWATTRLAEAWRDGVDVISITDHSDYNPHKDDVKIDLNRPYELLRPLAERAGIILIPGIELAEGDTHCNALFVKDANTLRGTKLIEGLQRARSQDAFVFWNHPGWKKTAEWFPLIAEAHDRKLLDGMELINGSTFYPEAYPWVEQKSLTILSNSDAHAPMAPAQPGNPRPLTLIFAKSADLAGVREAMFQRRTAAWMGGEVWGAETYLAGLFKGAVKLENPELTIRRGAAGPSLRISNESALPFKVHAVKMPGWLRTLGSDIELRRQSIVAGAAAAAKNAPLGLQRVDLVLEITNLHVGPGKNLVVTLPLVVNVIE